MLQKFGMGRGTDEGRLYATVALPQVNVGAWVRRLRFVRAIFYDAFGDIGTAFRVLGWKKPIH